MCLWGGGGGGVKKYFGVCESGLTLCKKAMDAIL